MAIESEAKFEGIAVELAILMRGIQIVLQENGFQLFHPNDLEYLAACGELIIRILAQWESNQSLSITVSRFVGEGEEFSSITRKIGQTINGLLTSSPG
jgi:hypothetical protein